MEPRTPPAWSLLALIPTIFVGFLGVGMIWYGLGPHLVPPGPGQERLVTLLGFYPIELLGILVPVLLLARAFKVDLRTTFPLGPLPLWRLGAILGATCGLAAMITYFQAWFARLTQLHYPKEIEQLITAQHGWEWLIFATGVAFIPALCEELATRGFLQSSLVPRWGLWPGIVVTALVFALFHLTPSGLPTYLVLGLWLSLVRHRTGTLWGNVGAHATNNMLAILQANLVPEPFWGPNAWWVLPLGLIVFLGLGWVSLKAPASASPAQP